MTDLRKLLPCCGYANTSALKWNEFNGVAQCHNCGQVYAPYRIDAALAEPVEPVAWIQPDHLAKAREAAFLCRVEPKQRDDFVPLYAAPAEQEELRTNWYLQAKRSDEMAKAWEREARELKERAEKAEAELKRAQEERDRLVATQCTSPWDDSPPCRGIHKQMKRAEKAEERNRRMVELLKEPSEGMINAGYPPNDERAQSWDVTEVFKAMSAELLKEVE